MTYKLICLDLDGTLVDRDTEVILAGVVPYFKGLEFPFPVFSLCTNQGGVGYGDYREQQGRDRGAYPTMQQADEHIVRSVSAIHKAIGFIAIRHSAMAPRYATKTGEWLGTPPYFSTNPGDENHILSRAAWSRLYRKPNPGMLWMAMMVWDAMPAETLFVGDSEEDEMAARAAGVDFEWADHFFNRSV